MADFAYKATNAQGVVDSGRLSAPSREEALRQLRAKGLTPLRLESATAGAGAGSAAGVSPQGSEVMATARMSVRARKPGHKDVTHLTGELSVMLSAGLPLDRALKVLIGMNGNPALSGLLEGVLADVKSGKGLSQALQPHRALFGDFYISMVRSGEAGGQLAQVLERLAEHLERMRELRDSIVSALIYPSILLLVAVLSVVLMLGFVVPQFEALFLDMGEALPLPTQIVVELGRFVTEWGFAMVAVLIAGAWGVRQWLRAEAGQKWRDERLLSLPVLGDILRRYEITRFARGTGTLLANGVPIVTAVEIGSETIGNQRLRQAIAGIIPTIKQGGRFALALETTGVLTPLAVNMVRLGEETGRLDQMLLEVARVHDREVQAGVKRGLTLVEPMLILVLGAAIAAIIISILMGILSLNELAI